MGRLILILSMTIFTMLSHAQLKPRWKAEKNTVHFIPAGTDANRLVIKVSENEKTNNINYDLLRDNSLIPVINNILKGTTYTIEPLIDNNREKLLARKQEAERRSGQEMADLSLYYLIRFDAGTETQKLNACNHIMMLPEMEEAYFEEVLIPATEAAYNNAMLTSTAATPDFSAKQTYQDAAPIGVNAKYAWTKPGGKGKGIKIIDCEYGWHDQHEDLKHLNINHLAGYKCEGQAEHGTCVAGVIGAEHNGFGINGIAPEVRLMVSTQYSSNGCSGISNSTALNRGLDSLEAGDVLLLEMQTQSMDPIETSSSIFNIIKTATGLGIIVVEAAGNGSKNLDASTYGGAFDTTKKNSGAFLIGSINSADPNIGGTSPVGGQRSTSCYGNRIDFHCWGEKVTTTGGYPSANLQSSGGTNYYYTSSFNGTSSASSIIAPTVAAFQGFYKELTGAPMPVEQLRTLFRTTGTKSTGAGDKVGVMPNLKAAIDNVLISGINGPTPENFKTTIFPNPFSNEAMITFEALPVAEQLKVFDMNGRAMFMIEIEKGETNAVINSKGLSPGCYYYQVGNSRGKMMVN